MSKKALEKPAEAGSASVSPYGSVLGYELVTSQPNRLINLIWPECRTWFIGPCYLSPTMFIYLVIIYLHHTSWYLPPASRSRGDLHQDNICQQLVLITDRMAGPAGAQIFAKRKKRAEKWVVDEEHREARKAFESQVDAAQPPQQPQQPQQQRQQPQQMPTKPAPATPQPPQPAPAFQQ